MILGLGLALAAPYDTPEVLEGRPLRRAERRCRRGNADACAVLGFTFLFSERPVEGEALIHSSCSKGSPLGCHLVSAGVLEGWWAGDLEAAQAEVDAQCLQDDILLSCRLARYALSDPTPHLLHACGLGDSLACGEYALRTQRLTGTLDVERLEVACADGYFCGALGNALMFGVDVEPDPKRGLALSTTECDGGDLRACAFCMGGAHLAGPGVAVCLTLGFPLLQEGGVFTSQRLGIDASLGRLLFPVAHVVFGRGQKFSFLGLWEIVEGNRARGFQVGNCFGIGSCDLLRIDIHHF